MSLLTDDPGFPGDFRTLIAGGIESAILRSHFLLPSVILRSFVAATAIVSLERASGWCGCVTQVESTVAFHSDHAIVV